MSLFILNDDVFTVILSFIDKNHLIILREISKIFNDIIIHYYKNKLTFPTNSTLFSNINYLEWAIEHNYKINKNKMYENAVKYGNVKMLDWLYETKSKNNFKIKLYNYAIEKADITILNWLKEHLCPYTENIHVPFSDNPLHMWINQNLPRNESQLCDIVKEGDLKKVLWVLKSIPDLEEYLCECCVRTNNMEILKWSYQNKIKSDSITITAAAQTGNLKILKWLVRHKFKYNENAITEACSNGHLNIVKWLLENNFPIDDWAFIECIVHSHFEILEYLIKNLKYEIDFYEYFFERNLGKEDINNIYKNFQKDSMVFNWLLENKFFDRLKI
jgi:ankyrin repeat protein